MDPAWVGAIAALISALVICATAIAAFAQLRHYRNANDIVVYLRIVDLLDAPEVRDALLRMPEVLPLLRDPAFRERLRTPQYIEEFAVYGRLLGTLEHLATLVIKGGVAESLVLAEYADNFERAWEAVREAVYLRRDAFGPYTGAAFEHLAMRAKAYRESGRMDREYGLLLRDPRGGDAVSL